MSVDAEAVEELKKAVDLGQKKGESIKLPPFLADEIRRREAYLTLLKDLTEHLGEEWSSRPEADCKARINAAIARSLKGWI